LRGLKAKKISSRLPPTTKTKNPPPKSADEIRQRRGREGGEETRLKKNGAGGPQMGENKEKSNLRRAKDQRYLPRAPKTKTGEAAARGNRHTFSPSDEGESRKLSSLTEKRKRRQIHKTGRAGSANTSRLGEPGGKRSIKLLKKRNGHLACSKRQSKEPSETRGKNRNQYMPRRQYKKGKLTQGGRRAPQGGEEERKGEYSKRFQLASVTSSCRKGSF